MDVLTTLRPHVLLRQELTHAPMKGSRAVWAEAARLGTGRAAFSAFLAQATPESAHPTAVYTDPELCEPTEYFEHTTGMWHPVCNPVVRLRGALSKLSLASVHMCSFDPERRAGEARRLTTLGKPGMAAIIGGDLNSYPHRASEEKVPLPNWATIEDRSHFEHRTIERGGHRVSDTRPDEILSGEHDGRPPVFTELGHYAATVLGQPDALTPTIGNPGYRKLRNGWGAAGGARGCSAAGQVDGVLGAEALALAVGLVVAVAVLAASTHDNTAGITLLDQVAQNAGGTVEKALVDQGFKNQVIAHGAGLGIDVEIVERNPQEKGFVPQPKRWRVEQTYGILILHRRLVRDYEHRPASSASRVYWAMAHVMARRLTGANTPTRRDPQAVTT